MKLRLPPVLHAYAMRIDAMSLRERALIFAACAAVLVAWTYVTVLEPILTERRTMAAATQKQRDEMRGWDLQIEAMARARAGRAGSPQRAQIVQLQERIAELDRRIDERRRQLVPPDRMRTLLAGVMRGRQSLRLVSLATLAPELIAGLPGEGAALMYRHGITLGVAGPYLDLLAYVTDLERLPVRLIWGEMRLSADYPVATLGVTLFTFSPEKTWLAL